MRILIVSDTHRRNDSYLEVVEKWKPLDMVIHCGDVEGSEDLIVEAAGCPVEMVQGNNDFFSDLPKEKEFTIGKYKVLLTHGHQYYVSGRHDFLVREAAARQFDIVMYGHTHRPEICKEKGVIVINPGSLTYPRQEGRRASYIIMEMDKGGEPEFTLHYV
jgi:hypothetical protein